ncbi:hypothetical protein BH11PAT2_BH11PAT2_00700 [soil metagenome]
MHIPVIPILFLAVACINTSIGTYVLLHNPKGKVNQAFFVFSLGAALWIGGFSLLLMTRLDMYIPLLNLGGILLLGGLFRLARVFSNTPLSVPGVLYLPLVCGAAIALYPGLLIQDVTFTVTKAIPIQGPYFPYYSAGFAIYTLASVTILAIAYRRATALETKRFQYFFLGIGVFIAATLLCDLILPAMGIFDLNFVGPLSSVISLCATAYAILRHRLMDIRIVIQRSLIYSMLLSLIVGFYVILAMGLDLVFTISEDIDGLIAGGITTLLSSFGIPFLLQFFRKITDPIFFKDGYSYAEALEKLSSILNLNINLHTLIAQSLVELDRVLHPKYLYFIYAQTEECFDCTGRISAENHPRLDQDGSQQYVLPIESGDHPLGEFILGPKRSGDTYSSEDHTLLRTFASQATVAIQKAELYQELLEHNDTLEQKVEDRTRHLQDMQVEQQVFFDDISHALQTPLTVLKSGVDLLTSGRATPDTKVYKSMEYSIDNLSQLIRNILDLSRIGTQALNVTSEIFNLSVCLSQILEYVGTVVHEQDISLSKDIEPSLCIRGNQKQIEEVITNLLSNAVRYTEGCFIRSIQVTLAAREDEIVLIVKDSGVGIAPTELKNLFGRFYRAETSRDHTKGYGLGLAIVKRIVTSHNGSVTVESELGIGTSFTVRFPRPSMP